MRHATNQQKTTHVRLGEIELAYRYSTTTYGCCSKSHNRSRSDAGRFVHSTDSETVGVRSSTQRCLYIGSWLGCMTSGSRSWHTVENECSSAGSISSHDDTSPQL